MSRPTQNPAATYALDGYALASRLSYFLWQSIPDDALTAAAQDGSLLQPGVLHAQAQRMLADPRSAAFLGELRNEWAGLAALGLPSATLGGLSDSVRLSMVGEVDAFFQDLVKNDRSFINVINGRYSFLNSDLAAYYGVAVPGGNATGFFKTDGAQTGRAGVVTTGALLTATAGDVAFTHPVKRGKWVAARVLCSEPPPPPPGIPQVNFDPGQGGTPREKLAAHTADPACSGCHIVMDVVGLGLENYDPFGRWRTTYPGSGAAIDPAGVLPDGTHFATPLEMYDALAKSPQVQSCLARQMMNLATTRAMASGGDDLCVTRVIGAQSLTPAAHFSDLVASVIDSRQFRMQTGEAP